MNCSKPNQTTRASNAFQQAIQISKKTEEEILVQKKALHKLGVPSRVVDSLHQQVGKLPQNEQAVKEMFARGEIPLGFEDRLLWSKTVHIFNHLSIENNLESIQQILASDYVTTAQSLTQAEEQLAIATRKQFESDVHDFAAINDDDTPNPKLSLVLNTFGMRKEVIMKVAHLDGYEFLDSNIELLCNQVGITTFGQVKQLMYVQNIMKNGVYLGGTHQEECPMCNATTVQDLKYLMEEHAAYCEDIKNVNIQQLMKLEINGPAFLALTTQDLSTHLKISDNSMRRSFSEAKRYFEAIHLAHLTQ